MVPFKRVPRLVKKKIVGLFVMSNEISCFKKYKLKITIFYAVGLHAYSPEGM